MKSKLVEFLAYFGGFYSLFAKKMDFGSGGLTISVTNFEHLLVIAYPENLEVTPLFAKKLVFGLGKVNFVVTNFDHLLVLAYPENLSQI